MAKRKNALQPKGPRMNFELVQDPDCGLWQAWLYDTTTHKLSHKCGFAATADAALLVAINWLKRHRPERQPGEVTVRAALTVYKREAGRDARREGL